MQLKIIDTLAELFALPASGAAAWGFFASFGFCVLLVLTKKWHGRYSLDSTFGIQKFHSEPTPRIGGVALAAAVAIASTQLVGEVRTLLLQFILAGSPALLFGLAEDVTKRVGVQPRLLATMASGLVACWLTGYSLHRVDVWGANELMQFTIVSVLFTAFAVGGVANAINIIDGFNGLASLTATFAFIGYAAMAQTMGDQTLASVALIFAACVLGFFWVNWPLGKIFWGDGGSYLLGFALAWVAVMLIERHPTVSVFAVLLPCIYPVTEALFSMYRRSRRNQHPGHPDKLHFHTLVKRRLVAKCLSGQSKLFRNSLTGLIVGTLSLAPTLLAYETAKSLPHSALSVLGFGFSYIILYIQIAKRR